MLLTKCELETLKDLAQGYTRREISVYRFRSVEAIKSRIKTAKGKLHAKNTINLVAIAKDMGLIMLLVVVMASCFSTAPRMRNVRMARGSSVRITRVEVASA